MSEKRIDEMTLADYRRAFENMERKRRPDPEPATFMGIDLAQGPGLTGFMAINDAGMAAVWEQGWIASSKEAARLTGVRFPRA